MILNSARAVWVIIEGAKFCQQLSLLPDKSLKMKVENTQINHRGNETGRKREREEKNKNLYYI